MTGKKNFPLMIVTNLHVSWEEKSKFFIIIFCKREIQALNILYKLPK